MHLTKKVFEQWAERLENEDEFFGLRWFAPGGGLIWRNRAAREFYSTHGFFMSATTPWAGIIGWFTPAELRRLNRNYFRAFLTREIITDTVTVKAPGQPRSATLTQFRAVYGTLQNGVLVTHLSPLPLAEQVSASTRRSPARLAH